MLAEIIPTEDCCADSFTASKHVRNVLTQVKCHATNTYIILKSTSQGPLFQWELVSVIVLGLF